MIVHHRECYESDAIATVPAHGHAIAAYRNSVDSAQLVGDDVIAAVVIPVAVVNELGVSEAVAAIVEHYVRPVETEHGHITQVDHVIGIAINVVSVAIEVVERIEVVSAKHNVKDTVDDGSGCQRSPSYGDYRTVPYPRSGTMYAYGRRQRTAPVVVLVVPAELITIVMLAVVETVVGIVTMVAVTVSAIAIAVTVTAFVLSIVVRVEVAGLAVATVVDVARLAGAAVVSVAGLASATLIVIGLTVVTPLVAVRLLAVAYTGVLDVGTNRGAAIIGQVLGCVGGPVHVASIVGGRGKSGGAPVAVAAAGGGATVNAGARTAGAAGTHAGGRAVGAAVHLRSGGSAAARVSCAAARAHA